MQTVKTHFEVAIAASERTLDIVSEEEVVAFGMLVPERNDICRIEVVRGPFALDGQRFLSASGKDKVNFVTALVSPVEDFSALRAGHEFIQHEVLP